MAPNNGGHTGQGACYRGWAIPREAALTAGVSTDFILAPITGPLDKAESFIEAAGIIVGLLTGGHALVLACLKLLVHNEGKRLAVRGAVKVLTGSQSDHPRSNTGGAVRHKPRVASDAQRTAPREAPTQPMPPRPEQHDVRRPPQIPVSQGAPLRRCQPTPSDSLWLCLAVVSEPPASTSAANPGPAATARKRRTTKPVVPLLGDDEFLKTPPGVLWDEGGTEADVPTARRSSFLSRG